MAKDKKQIIKCDVSTCKYNDCDCNLCNLKKIKISCNCDNEKCTCISDTVCDSYEEKEDA